MSYVELLGLPGSGKSTVLRELRRLRGSSRFRTFSSEGRLTIFRRVGVDWARSRNSEEWSRQNPRDRVARVMFDRWGADSLSSFPELMSRVLFEIALIPKVGREREIVLNYWKVRLAVFRHITRQDSSLWGVVDEGLSQTVMSTLVRKKSCDDYSRALSGDDAQTLMALLPTNRRLVYLQVSPEIVHSRFPTENWYSEGQILSRARILEEIVHAFHDQSGTVLRLDGTLDPSIQARRISAWLERERSRDLLADSLDFGEALEGDCATRTISPSALNPALNRVRNLFDSAVAESIERTGIFQSP